MNQPGDDEYVDRKLDELTAKLVESLRTLGMDEEGVQHAMSDWRDRFPELRKYYELMPNLMRREYAYSMERIIDRQGSHFPDFDDLYRRKAELDQRAVDSPLPPPS